jgi:hypothetical protein
MASCTTSPLARSKSRHLSNRCAYSSRPTIVHSSSYDSAGHAIAFPFVIACDARSGSGQTEACAKRG